MTNTLCSLPWLHLFVDGMGHFNNCCLGPSADGFSRDSDGETILAGQPNAIRRHWNSSLMQEIRKSMHEGTKHKSCDGCWRIEDTGSESYRISANRDFLVPKEIQNKISVDPMIRWVDLRFGNLCNLACRMCLPYSSKKLFTEYELMYGPQSTEKYKNMTWYESEHFWDELFQYSDYFERIHLAGGEPLLIKDCWKFLRKIASENKSKNINLSYNTNLTRIPAEAKELWPKFKGIILLVSMDGIGKINEFIRYPQKWSDIESNLWELEDKFKEYNIQVCQIQPTIQAYNIHHIPDYCDYVAKFKNIKRIPNFNLLFGPEHFSPSVLPRSYREDAVGKIENYIQKVESGWNSYEERDKNSLIISLKGVIKYILSEDRPELLHEFIRHNDIYDTHRNQKILEYIPELEVVYRK